MRIAGTFVPPVAIDRRSGTPLHRQLYDWFRNSITSGQIAPGMRVPSTRSLAAELSISRMPVVNAYDQLLVEGYFETFVGSGTRVARSIPHASFNVTAVRKWKEQRVPSALAQPRRLSHRGVALAQSPKPEWLNHLGAFRVSLPALDHFPVSTWTKLVTWHARRHSRGMMAYGSAIGYLSLREAIAQYIGAARGVRCETSQIIVTTGSQQALQIAAHVLMDHGDQVCVEEPGYPGAHKAFTSAGAELIPIPLDAEGMMVSELDRCGVNARVVYVTPSHQYPLGMTMSAARRISLLNWAARCGRWIIEDDYDSEYRFDSRPVPSLQGLDSASRVIYLGTFSKVMFPALRLGYMVVPKDLLPAFAGGRYAADIFSATLLQAVMADFIQEGHLARHIRRMRMLYMDRRSRLVNAISSQIGDPVEIVGAEAGMHLVALLAPGVKDVDVVREANQKGVQAIALSTCCLRVPNRGGLILGYGGTDARQIQAGVKKLRAILVKDDGGVSPSPG